MDLPPPEFPDFGAGFGKEQSGEGLSRLVEDDPLSPQFNPGPLGESAGDLVRYMIACQKRRFGQTFLEKQPERVLVRNMKLLLEQHSAAILKRAIKLAEGRAQHPFSTKFIKQQAEEVEQWVVESGVRLSNTTSMPRPSSGPSELKIF
jgi:hypothetical protein